MPRIRYLKPEFFSDEDLAELKFETRLTFSGLWCYADKLGRLEDRPKFLKAMIFPYDNVDMEKQLQSLCKKPFIIRYEVDGKPLIQIINWEKHQKPHHTEADSKFPPAPPLKEIIKGMGMEKQLDPSLKLENGEIPVKIPSAMKSIGYNGFESFWVAYPKKKNKGDAEDSWKKIKPNAELLQKILIAIGHGKKSNEWQKDKGQWIPYPASWLNAKGWEDEYNPPNTDSVRPSEPPAMIIQDGEVKKLIDVLGKKLGV